MENKDMESLRRIDYLRLSITDRCNLRCVYCMPLEGIETVAHDELLRFEEIIRLIKIFVGIGIKKIRLTGGEPLVRKGVIDLIRSLAEVSGIEEVSLTTNGVLLIPYLGDLKNAGLKRINISLDTLDGRRFKEIMRNDSLDKVLEGIREAKRIGFSPLKLNTVIMRGVNDDEIIDFVNFALGEGLILRFIEFMKVTPLWDKDYFVPIEEVRKICEENFGLSRTDSSGSGPAVYYKTGQEGLLGFIKTDEYNCMSCNRLRLTSTGELKICLYETHGLRLKGLLRSRVCDEEIRDILKARLKIKEVSDYRCWRPNKVYMSSLGG